MTQERERSHLYYLHDAQRSRSYYSERAVFTYPNISSVPLSTALAHGSHVSVSRSADTVGCRYMYVNLVETIEIQSETHNPTNFTHSSILGYECRKVRDTRDTCCANSYGLAVNLKNESSYVTLTRTQFAVCLHTCNLALGGQKLTGSGCIKRTRRST